MNDEISYLLAALEADPENWRNRRFLADYYLQQGDERRAIALVTTAPVAPATEDDAVFAAQVASRLSLKRAHHLLDAFLVHNASSAKAHFLKAQFYEQQGDAANAAVHLKVARVLNPYFDESVPLQATQVDAVEMHELAQSYEHAGSEVAPAPVPEMTKVQTLRAPDEVLATAVPVAATAATVTAVNALTPDVAPPAPQADMAEVAATPVAPVAVAAPVAPLMAGAEDVASMPHSMDEVMAGMTAMIALTPSQAAQDPEAVLRQIEEEEAGDSHGDMLSSIVERQTAMVAAMSDTSEETMARPDIKEQKSAKDKFSAILIAVGIHLAIIAAFGLVVMSIPQNNPPEIYASMSNVDSDTDLEKAEIKKPTVQKTAPQAQQVPVMTSAAMSDVAMPTVDMSVTSPFMGVSAEMGMDFGMSFADPGGGAGMSSIPPSMAGRCSMGQRMARLKESGATTACEAAVRKALRFMKSNQNEDGSFGKEYPAAITALAILAFLGHCETPDSLEFGDAVTKATLYLMERASKSKGDYIQSEGLAPTDRTVCYEHPIVTYALCEMYTMTKASGAAKRIPRLESSMKRAVRGVIDGQDDTRDPFKAGGWAYSYAQNGHVDTSVVGWNFQALKAATHTGESITGLEKALDKAIEHLEEIQTPDGGFPYKGGDAAKATLTPVGVLAYEMWEKGDSEEAEKGFDWMEKHILPAAPNSYGWYYAMQAYFIEGGDKWKKWNAKAMPAILSTQTSEGNFTMPGGHGPKEPIAAAVYNTALCTLMLEVYYRYLPTTQKNLGGR